MGVGLGRGCPEIGLFHVHQQRRKQPCRGKDIQMTKVSAGEIQTKFTPRQEARCFYLVYSVDVNIPNNEHLST